VLGQYARVVARIVLADLLHAVSLYTVAARSPQAARAARAQAMGTPVQTLATSAPSRPRLLFHANVLALDRGWALTVSEVARVVIRGRVAVPHHEPRGNIAVRASTWPASTG
jgi:hypothetical protein